MAEERIYPKGTNHAWGSPIYKATFNAGLTQKCEGFSAWRSSTTMPRWASRITLEVTAVKAERLNAISRDDVMAEGMPPDGPMSQTSPIGWFESAWNAHHPRTPWDANPWVWVYEIRRIG